MNQILQIHDNMKKTAYSAFDCDSGFALVRMSLYLKPVLGKGPFERAYKYNFMSGLDNYSRSKKTTPRAKKTQIILDCILLLDVMFFCCCVLFGCGIVFVRLWCFFFAWALSFFAWGVVSRGSWPDGFNHLLSIQFQGHAVIGVNGRINNYIQIHIETHVQIQLHIHIQVHIRIRIYV